MAVFVLPEFLSDSAPGAGSRPRSRVPASLLAAILLLGACASDEPSAVDEPGTGEPASAEVAAIENCDQEIAPDAPFERVFAMNSGSIENLLALGVEDRIIGAVGKPENVREDLRPRLDEVDIIHPGGADYPSSEAVLETEPDAIYSVYPSAFREGEGVASREELHGLGIATYLAPGRCPDRDEEQSLGFEDIWTELRELATLLDVEERAEQVITEEREAIDAARSELPDAADLEVFWWDMGTDGGPTAGACCGAPGMILRELGLDNAFDDLPGHWAGTSWEQVVERDPDLVVIADMGDGDLDDKLAFIEDDPTLRELRAFRGDAVVVLPFSQTTPGLQNVAAIETIGAFLTEHDDVR